MKSVCLSKLWIMWQLHFCRVLVRQVTHSPSFQINVASEGLKCFKLHLHERGWSLTYSKLNNSDVIIFIMIGIKQRQASFTELLSHTVHLWKSWDIASKGYIHCTCRINLLNRKYWFTLIERLLKLTTQTVTEHRTTNTDRRCEYLNGYVTVQHCCFRKQE